MKNECGIYANVVEYDNPVTFECDRIAELAIEIAKVSGFPEADIQTMQLSFSPHGVVVSASFKCKRAFSNNRRQS